MTSLTSLVIFPALVLLGYALSDVIACDFPRALQIDSNDPPWYSHIRGNGSRDVEYYIRHNVMEIHYPSSAKPHVRWKCTLTFHDKLLLKREDHMINSFYRCAKFVIRSTSVVQIFWSHESKTFDLALCEDTAMKLDHWPLIRFKTLDSDYKQCPFSGGFDMKMIDSKFGANGCNLMVRPMRMESECLGGEGVVFDYIASNCLPDIRMFVQQKTVCMTDWRDSRYHYVILRRSEDTDLWCLVMPVHRTGNITAYLFSDLTCRSDFDRLNAHQDLKYFTLHLRKREFPTLCEDEYDQCKTATCNSYFKNECQKSCHVCDASSTPPSCEFPADFQGKYFLRGNNSYNQVELTRSRLSIDRVGDFRCVAFPDSPKPDTRMYTTVSYYDNGCRPRYTCLKLARLSQSVLRYSLSQSYDWPMFQKTPGATICDSDRFHPDPTPVDDLYRSHEGSGIPIVSLAPKPELVECNITSVYAVSATLPEGYSCMGSLYSHCEDKRKLRLEFGSCGSIIAPVTDYQCLAVFQGHYWERILLVQNLLNDTDTLCFVFSQLHPHEAYALVAKQCDQKSFNFARSKLRTPLLKLQFRIESDPCKSVPVKTATSKSEVTPSASRIADNARKDDRQTYGKQPHPSSMSATETPSEKTMPHKAGHVNDAPDAPRAKSTSFGGGDPLPSTHNENGAENLTLSFFAMTVLLCAFLT
ncbi:uncharacterized protein LOC131954582 [Physella acuta]|uniref:uncharacterized protein LOC131954582 n=1 Tax=Physella acuta TaxID=109671 RepID=UPI0027DB1454|nr:uncharacterized protein LOC131954582 [Physella acuta]